MPARSILDKKHTVFNKTTTNTTTDTVTIKNDKNINFAIITETVNIT